MTFCEEIEDEIKEFVSRTENIYYFSDSDYGVEYLNNNFSFFIFFSKLILLDYFSFILTKSGYTSFNNII